MHPFQSKQLARNGADVFLISRIDALTPLPRLNIEVLPTREPAPGKKVVLNKVEGPFDAGRTVGVADLVSSELKAEAFAEGLHLRHRNHLPSRAAQHNHVSIIDHDPTAGAAEKTHGIGQEDFAVKALERGVTLKEQHPRVAQDGRCGLDSASLSSDLDLMRRSVMLQFLARLKLVLPDSHFRFLSDSMAAAKGR